MPNWVRNKLTFSERREEILAYLAGPNGPVDFNNIAPMPSGLDVEDSSVGDDAMRYLVACALNPFSTAGAERHALALRLPTDVKQRETALNLGRQYLRNIADHGHKGWYDWSTENWGTKWNATEAVVTDDGVTFETAWNGVPALMRRLFAAFPGVHFGYSWAGEDTGSCVGIISGRGSSVSSRIPDSQSAEAYQMAFALWPESARYYRFVDGRYEYVDADTEEP